MATKWTSFFLIPNKVTSCNVLQCINCDGVIERIFRVWLNNYDVIFYDELFSCSFYAMLFSFIWIQNFNLLQPLSPHLIFSIIFCFVRRCFPLPEVHILFMSPSLRLLCLNTWQPVIYSCPIPTCWVVPPHMLARWWIYRSRTGISIFS